MNLVFPGTGHLIITHRGWGIWSLALISHYELCWFQIMAETNLDAFIANDTWFVVDLLKRKGLHKLCSVFEGIQEPFILPLACKLNHVYIHNFWSIIEATEKFPRGGGIWSSGMDLWWGIWTAFQPREWGIWTKSFQKFKCPGGCPGGMFKLRFDWYIIWGLFRIEIFWTKYKLQFEGLGE